MYDCPSASPICGENVPWLQRLSPHADRSGCMIPEAESSRLVRSQAQCREGHAAPSYDHCWNSSKFRGQFVAWNGKRQQCGLAVADVRVRWTPRGAANLSQTLSLEEEV
jgi:hypothetical protein